MKTIWLMRHGQSLANLEDQVGEPYSKLSPEGVAQAKARALEIKPDLIITSTFYRSIETAQAFSAESLSLADFKERSFGALEKEPQQIQLKKFKKHLDHLPKTDRAYIKFVRDMETDLDAYLRFQRGVFKILEYPHENILIITHSNIMRIFLDYSNLLIIRAGGIANCGWIKLGWENQELTLIGYQGIKGEHSVE